MALSNGQRVAPLNAYRNTLVRLARYQRGVSRKIEAQKRSMGLYPKKSFPRGVHPPKSNRQRRAETRVARCHRKIAAQRRDWLHKLTTCLANDNAVVMLEDLKVKNMTASAAGTIEMPGKRVAQKRGMNRSILDQGWGLLERMLGYKLAWRAAQLIKVPAPYTSQKCSCCGHIDAANRKDKKFFCVKCSHADDADINAAKNILAAGLAVLARQTPGNADVEGMVLSGRPIRTGKPGRAKRQPANAEGGASCAA